MARKKLTEQDLLKGLDAHTAHADELADPLPQELAPLERLKGSVKRYERPTDINDLVDFDQITQTVGFSFCHHFIFKAFSISPWSNADSMWRRSLAFRPTRWASACH